MGSTLTDPAFCLQSEGTIPVPEKSNPRRVQIGPVDGLELLLLSAKL